LKRHEQLSDQIEQQVDLEIEPLQLRRLLVLRIGRTVLLDRREGLQHAYVALGKAGDERLVDRAGQHPPQHRDHVLVGELLVQNYRIGTIEHGRKLSKRPLELVTALRAAT